MKKLLRLVFLLTTIAVAQNNFFQYRILNPIGGATATGHTLFAHTAGLAASYSSINWAVTGTLAACTVQVDYSNDGSTVAGQLIAAQTCTSNGTFTAASTTTPAYVRVSYVIGSGGGTLSFAAYGCNNATCSGSGGGSLSSLSQGAGIVLTPNPITTTGTVALNVALPNGETATTQSNGDSTTKVATDAFVLNNSGSGFSGSLTANKVTKATGAHALADSTGVDDGVSATNWPLGLDIGTAGAYDFQIPNNGSTGTTALKTVCDDGTGKGIVCPHATSTTNVVLGFCVNGCGTTGNATVSMLGYPSCIYDNASTSRNYAINSTTVDGDLHDTGSATAPAGQPFFFNFTANAGTGTAGIVRMLLADDFINASPTASYTLQVNGTQLVKSDTVNFNTTTPAAGANGINITIQTSKSSTTDRVSGELVGDGNAAHFLSGAGTYVTPAGTGVTSVTVAGTTNQITATGTCTITTTGTCTLSLPSTLVLPNGTTATSQAQLDGSTKVATDSYVDTAVSNAIAGVNPAVAVQAATTAAGDTSSFVYSNGVSGIGATLTGPTANVAVTIDGFTFTALGQRLLVKNDTQSPSGAFNGIYYVTTLQAPAIKPILTRALDYDQSSDINNTGAIPVINGTANGTTQWVLTSTVNTVGTDPLTYVKFSSNPSTLVTNVTGTSPVVSSGGTTPAISISGVTSEQGNGAKLQLSTGSTTTNDCVKFDANGNTVDAGAACGAGTPTATVNVQFDKCVPAQTTNAGNSFFTVNAFTHADLGIWQFVLNTVGDVYCYVRVPHNLSGTTGSIIIDIAVNDNVASRGATFKTCDAITASANLQVGALTCTSTQTANTTTTAYSNTELTFAVQSTLAADQYLVVDIEQTTSSASLAANPQMPPPVLQIVETF